MINEITSEATTWLGYLQRGSVLLQVGLFVAAISSESRVKRKLVCLRSRRSFAMGAEQDAEPHTSR